NRKEDDELFMRGLYSSGHLLKVAAEVLAVQVAAKRENYELGVEQLIKVEELESMLRYDEPPTWLYSVSENKEAVLIEAGKFREAEEVYLKDLEEFPEKGWALYGLYQALSFQNKFKEAGEIKKRFDAAWKYSDVVLKSSRIL